MRRRAKQKSLIAFVLSGAWKNVLDKTKTSKRLNQLCISFFIVFRRLTVALAYFCSVIKGITPENLHVVFCPSKQCCFEHFMCLDFVEMSLTVWDVAYAAVNTETLNLFIYMSCKCLWPHTMCTNLPHCNLHDDIARYFTL